MGRAASRACRDSPCECRLRFSGTRCPTADRDGSALPNVPRQLDRQLPARVGDTEQRVRERDTLVRAAVVGREERREAVDHRRKALRAPERHDGDRRLSEVRDSVDQLDLLWRQVDVRGVLALAFGEVVAVPAGFAADVQDDDVGLSGGRHRARDVARIRGQHAGPRRSGDLGVRQQPADRLGKRDRGVVRLA